MKKFIQDFKIIVITAIIGFSAVGFANAQAANAASFLNQAPFRNGVFKNPAYEEVNQKFPNAFKFLMGTDGKVFGSFYTYRQVYMDAEKALAGGTSTDIDADMFKMAYSYEILSCICDFYVSKGKLKSASDESIDNQALKKIVSDRVKAEPAEIWTLIRAVGKIYLPKDDTFKGRVAFTNKQIIKSGDNATIALMKWGLVLKIFNDYREGKHANRKIK